MGGCKMNPTLKRISDKIMSNPDIKYPKNSSRGYVSSIYYNERKCDVVYWAPDGTKMTKHYLDFPKDGDGLFTQSLKVGDVVEISYKGKTHSGVYISGVKKKDKNKKDFNMTKGQSLPISTDLF